MIQLTPNQTVTLKDWFRPERPGPLIGSHIIHTGHGTCHVDRWPEPRVVLVETAGNYTLLGDAGAVEAADLQPHLKGFVEASAAFEPLLKRAFASVVRWDRVILAQPADAELSVTPDVRVRRLEPSDERQLQTLSHESNWIGKTWGGAAGLAASGFGWGAFVGEQLASVACTFFLGETYEDIGVATEPRFCGQGLSTACTAALCREIRARGHQPSWTTSPDNIGSLRVAEKLGFIKQRDDLLYVVGIEIPPVAHHS